VQTAWSTVSRIDFARKRDMYMIWFDGGSQHSRMMPPDHALTASQLDGFQKSSTTGESR
jgi:hypothetical protein